MTKFLVGDCLDVLDKVEDESVDLIYVDPPFFSQTDHRLSTRDGKKFYTFSDVWNDQNTYANFIFLRLNKLQEKLKPTGSIFFHCDKSASHIIRLMLDHVFGVGNFQSEIIWHYRRWSNTKRGLLNAHQTIYFYSKSAQFKFFPQCQSYSATTNIDQIMQKRSRDQRNKSIYARNEDGEVISNGIKKGVPLSDVWEIPFLNPKAKERVGFPTQKPVLLLKQIIELSTETGDTVLDPFCGSGTTLVAAEILGRNALGIDVSQDAIELAKQRVANPIITYSDLLKKGLSAYKTHCTEAAAYLQGVEYIPVQRNKGIDGLLKHDIQDVPVFIRVQRSSETQQEAAAALRKASQSKGKCLGIVVVIKKDISPSPKKQGGIIFVHATNLALLELMAKLNIPGNNQVLA